MISQAYEKVSSRFFSIGTVKISAMGNRAWLVEAPGEFNLAAQRRIWAFEQRLSTWPEVESLIPGVTNLLVLFVQTPTDPELLVDRLRATWEQTAEIDVKGKVIEIPVCYGGEHATDLASVCQYTGLQEKEVIKRHYSASYTVVALGSAPGFGYLHGLDPMLATPRKKVPSLNMLKGTVTIGGAQTGLSVLTGPNGWNAIGYADLDVFNPERNPPALMAPGDTIRFLPERIEL